MSNLPPSPTMHADDLFQSQGSSRHTYPVTASSTSEGLSWENGAPCIRMQDAVVETVVTHVTRTTTSFAPLPLPRIPMPKTLAPPSHLSVSEYPLLNMPTPDDLRFFPLNLGGRRVVIQEEGFVPSSGSPSSSTSVSPGGSAGAGWTRNFMSSNRIKGKEVEGIGLLDAVEMAQGKEARKRNHPNYHRPMLPTPPVVHDLAPTPHRSPPRKRVRGLDNLNIPQDGQLLSPLPSPDHEAPPPLPTPGITSPTIGSGHELAVLYSLPAVVANFDAMPDRLQQHILMQLLRRSRMPTIQRISEFAGAALKRDFISRLPHELAVQVLARMDTGTLAQASRVSKKWRHMIDTERGIWKQRLIDEDLWTGLGVEEAEEENISQRYQTLDEQARLHGYNRDDQDMLDDAAKFNRPVPLKHVYRRRYLSNKGWFQGEPNHTTFPGHGTSVVTCLQFDADKIISASDDHSINVYDTRTGQLRKRLEGHTGGVWALQYNKNDQMVTGSTDRTVRIWDLETLTQAHVWLGHNSTVRCLEIVEPVLNRQTGQYEPPYPVIITGSRDCLIRVWKLPRRGAPPNHRLNDHTIAPVPVAENPYHLHLLEGHSSAIRALAAHGRICASASYDNTVRVWDIVKGVCLHTLVGHEARVYSVVLDPHRNRCASGSMDNTVKVWDLKTGECLSTLVGHTSLVGLLDVSPNFIVSAAADSSLRVWDANTHNLIQLLATNGGAITCFQHDETKLISGSEGSLKLWDIRKGYYIRDLVIGNSSVWQVAFNGNLLVAASNRQGSTVFDVFDFGKIRHCSGVDDNRLDRLRRPAWECVTPTHRRTGKGKDNGMEIEGIATEPSASAYIAELPSLSRRKRGKGSDKRSRRSTRLAIKAGPSICAPDFSTMVDKNFNLDLDIDQEQDLKEEQEQDQELDLEPPLPQTQVQAGPSTPIRAGSSTHRRQSAPSASARASLASAGPSSQHRLSVPTDEHSRLAQLAVLSPRNRDRYALGPPRTRRSVRNQPRLLSNSPSPAGLSFPSRDGGPSTGTGVGTPTVPPQSQYSLSHITHRNNLGEGSSSRPGTSASASASTSRRTRQSQSVHHHPPGHSFAPIMVDDEEDDSPRYDVDAEVDIDVVQHEHQIPNHASSSASTRRERHSYSIETDEAAADEQEEAVESAEGEGGQTRGGLSRAVINEQSQGIGGDAEEDDTDLSAVLSVSGSSGDDDLNELDKSVLSDEYDDQGMGDVD